MIAGVDYRPVFLDAGEAAALHDLLLAAARWQQESLHLFGRTVAVPRLLAWYGDAGLNYRYSGADHPCDGWLPALDRLRQRLQAVLELPFNFVLVNRYRHGADYMGWHRDDERGMGRWVASVSVGAERRLLVRADGQQRSQRLDLAPGSLLVMDGRLRHSLPRTRTAAGERINLTFRHLCREGG